MNRNQSLSAELSNRRPSLGFTIVELMISVLVGLVLASGIVTVFTNSRHSFDRDSNILRMQDDARQAIRELTYDLSMAGFWADLLAPQMVVVDGGLSVASDCGPAGIVNWIYQPVVTGALQSQAIAMVDNATAVTADASFSCLGADVVPGTDIISIKRVAGAVASGALTAGNVYLRSNGTLGLLYQEPVAAPAIVIPAPYKDWEYRPSIYYVRRFAVDPADGIPTLCRKILRYAANPTIETECLAQGVENLQIEFGLDVNADGSPDGYVANPTPAQMLNAVSAEIYVLTRSATPDFRYTNDKTFTVSNAPAYTPADNFYRRVFSVSISLRNLRSLRMFQR